MKPALRSWLPGLFFAVALALGLGITAMIYLSEEQRSTIEAEKTADNAVDRILTRLGLHVVVLRGTKGLFGSSEQRVRRETLADYLAPLGIQDDLSGIQGVGFARMVMTGSYQGVIAEVLENYGRSVSVKPETDQKFRTPIVLLEPPNTRNLNALGFDMYSNPLRREAMDRAIRSGEPEMSAPVELVQEITEDKQMGFLIYLPLADRDVDGPAPVEGFVYAPFRAGDLMTAALSQGAALPVELRVTDHELPDQPLLENRTEAPGARVFHRSHSVYGRTWDFDILVLEHRHIAERHGAAILAALASILLASATGMTIRARQAEARVAREAESAATREAEHRRLLLQEMAHRIKNHITRIQSIARQSARGASSVKEFTDSFDARLRAMAGAQDLLSGKAIPRTDLRAILVREIGQLFDRADAETVLSGPDVPLEEAHAVALVAHELLTNSMKYGGMRAQGRGLSISWAPASRAAGEPAQIAIDWVEGLAEGSGAEAVQTQTPSPGRGFGLKLIEACLRGELQGSMTRDVKGDELHIRLIITPIKTKA